jgi:hypothetical protein
MSTDSPYIPVGDLEKSFAPDNNSLDPVADLSGRSLTLCFDNGRIMNIDVTDGKTLRWRVITGEGEGEDSAERYYATNPRPGIYFVDFVSSRGRAASVSLVLDFNQGIVTAVLGELPERTDVETPFLERIAAGRELTAVAATFLHGSIDNPFSPVTTHHQPTTELVGKRIEYTYSLTEQYEHVYLNPNLYTWHCLRGSEQGLGDADRCHYFKLADQMYLFVWREKIVPTLGVVLIDLAKLKTTGKIFGYQENDFGKLSNFPVGARARIVTSIEPRQDHR